MAPKRRFDAQLSSFVLHGVEDDPNPTGVKYVDTYLSTFVANNTGTGIGAPFGLNLPNLGTDITEHIGDVIELQSLQLRWFVAWQLNNTPAVQSSYYGRMLIVYDRFAGVPDADPSNLLDYAGVAVQDRMMAFPKVDNMNRFVILYDKIYGMTCEGDFYGERVYEETIPLVGLRQIFSSPGNTCINGRLCVYTIGSITAGFTVGPFYARVTFTDC